MSSEQPPLVVQVHESTCGAQSQLGMVELCAKNLQIMRNDFTDYARTFCELCATILKIMRALSHFFANYAHLPRKVVNNDVSSELPTISK